MLILENRIASRMLIIIDEDVLIVGYERKKTINNMLDAKPGGWYNTSQHSKRRQERNQGFENMSQDNMRWLGEERKIMINDALYAKHQGW